MLKWLRRGVARAKVALQGAATTAFDADDVRMLWQLVGLVTGWGVVLTAAAGMVGIAWRVLMFAAG